MNQHVTVGKAPDNDISVSDDQVSRHHAVFFPVNEGWQFHDLHSTNGSFVNGKRVTAATVTVTDVVTLGRRFRLDLTEVEVAGRQQGERSGFLRIGKAADNDLIVDDPHVSRHHALLKREGDGAQLFDAGSTNGTLVDGRRVTHTAITPHSEVVLGTTYTAFGADLIPRVEPPPATAPPSSRGEAKTGRTTVFRELMGQLDGLQRGIERERSKTHKLVMGGAATVLIVGALAYKFLVPSTGDSDLVSAMETMRQAIVMIRCVTPEAGVIQGGEPTARVRTENIELFSEESGQESQGSGFVYYHHGRPLVITNHHVVEPWLVGRDRGLVPQLLIMTQGAMRSYEATVLKIHREHDVAVLGFTGDTPRCPKLVLQPDWSAVNVGDQIGFMSFPLGLSAQAGPLRADLNTGLVNNKTEESVKHNIDSAPGASGGPMFNGEGEVIAINRAQSRDRLGQLYQGLNWGVPVRYAAQLLQEL